MAKPSAVRLVVFGTILIIVVAYAAINHRERLLGYIRPAASLNAQAPAPGAQAQPANLWYENHPEPVGVEVFFLTPNDATGLKGNWNFEIADTMRRLTQSWAALAGKPFTTQEYWSGKAAERRRELKSTAFGSMDVAAAVKIGAELKAQKVVQTETRKDTATSSVVAVVRLMDVPTGKVVGEWSSEPVPGITYESLFNSQVQLAPVVTAALCGMNGRDELLAAVRGRATAEARARAEQDATSAIALAATPCTADQLQALRLAIGAVDGDPTCANGWLAMTMALSNLADQTALGETQTLRDTMERALIAGELASALAPDDPHARLARMIGLAANGRFAEAMRIADAELKARPADPVARAWRAVLYQQKDDVPEPTPDVDGNIVRFCKLSLDATGPADQTDKFYQRCLGQYPYSPGLWEQWSRYLTGRGELSVQRYANTAASVTGSVLWMEEIIRQLELAGKTAEARDAASAALKAMGAPAGSATTDGTIADGFSASAREWVSSSLRGAVDVWWRDGSAPPELLALAAQWNEAAKKMLAGKQPGVRPGVAGAAYTSGEWIALAARPALDGASESIADFVSRLGSGPEAGEAILAIIPTELPALNAMAQYHYSVHFDNRKVDEYHRRMAAQDPWYLPKLRREAKWARGDLPTQAKKVIELKYMAPFHTDTLYHVASTLQDMQDYGQAADHWDLLNTRYPLNYNVRLTGLWCRAVSEGRLITTDEIAGLEAQLPTEYKNRTLLLAGAYRSAAETSRALELYLDWIEKAKPTDTNVYYRASWLRRIEGDIPGAIAILEKYVEKDPSSLQTCSVLNDMAWIYLRAGDLEAAERTWRRSASVDNWKYDVVYLGAFLDSVAGREEQMQQKLRQNAERYPGNNSYGDLGWALLATGSEDEALTLADKGISMQDSEANCFELRAMLLRRKGDTNQALATLQRFDGRMIDDPEPQRLLVSHFRILGDVDSAVRCAREQLRRAPNGEKVETAMEQLARLLVETGDYDGAAALAQRLHTISPVDVESDAVLANICLAKGDAAGCLAKLDKPLKIGGDETWALAARAYLAAGDAAKAFEYAQLARKHRIVPRIDLVMLEGDAAAAAGKNEEARKAYTLCTTLEGPQAKLAMAAKEKLEKMPHGAQ